MMAALAPRTLPAAASTSFRSRPTSILASTRPARLAVVACQPSNVTATVVTERVELKAGAVHPLEATQWEALMNAAGPERLVVVDVYTTWCGPCKMIAPEVEKMAQDFAESAVIAKLDCTQSADNKKWAMKHNVKALPTFLLFKDGKRVNDMTGAKASSLRKLIESHLPSMS